MLEVERLQIAAVENECRQSEAQARQHVAAAQSAQRTAETRLADLERLLEQQHAQLSEMQERCAALNEERRVAQQEVNTLRQAQQGTQQQLSQEREATATYVRGVEDRSHQEVDRAREESKAIAVQLKDTHKRSEQLRQRLDRTLEQLSQAQQVAAAESARATTLAQQLKPARAKRARTSARKRPQVDAAFES